MMKLSLMIILKIIVSRNLIPIGNINGTSYLVIDKNKKYILYMMEVSYYYPIFLIQ